MMQTMFIANSVWQGLMGLYLLGFPSRPFGALNDNGRSAVRMVGAAFVGLGAISFLALDSAASELGSNIGLGFMIYHVLDSLVAYTSYRRTKRISIERRLRRRSMFAACLHALFAVGFGLAYVGPNI